MTSEDYLFAKMGEGPWDTIFLIVLMMMIYLAIERQLYRWPRSGVA